jgi:hypothetical protein
MNGDFKHSARFVERLGMAKSAIFHPYSSLKAAGTECQKSWMEQMRGRLSVFSRQWWTTTNGLISIYFIHEKSFSTGSLK